MTACPSVAYLVVDGREVAMLRCSLEAGHDVERWANGLGDLLDAAAYARHNSLGGESLPKIDPTPHEARLTWDNPEGLLDSWPEYADPDEGFDLEVDIAPAEVVESQAHANDRDE